MAILHLMCGVPGAGKTTLAKQLARELPALRLTPDEWLYQVTGDGYDVEKRLAVEAVHWEIAAQFLTLGVDVILENGFRSRAERDEFRMRAANVGAAIEIHFLHASFEELKKRLALRDAIGSSDTFQVTEEQLACFLAHLEPPSEEELSRLPSGWASLQRRLQKKLPTKHEKTRLNPMATLHLVRVGQGNNGSTRQLRLELRALRLAASEWMARLGEDENDAEKLISLEGIQWEIAERALLCGLDVLFELSEKSKKDVNFFQTKVALLGAQTRVYLPERGATVFSADSGLLMAPAMDQGW